MDPDCACGNLKIRSNFINNLGVIRWYRLKSRYIVTKIRHYIVVVL